MVIQQTRKIMFLKSGKFFLKSVVNNWYKLADTDKGNIAQGLNITGSILRHLNCNMLESPKSLGVFIENNVDSIRLLIPKADKRRQQKLFEYYSLGIFYQKN